MSQSPTLRQNGAWCPTGKYCSVLEVGSQTCVAGTYNVNIAQASCLGCEAGLNCADPADPVKCTSGNYCPAQTTSVNNEEVGCPAGTYQTWDGAGLVSDCIPCPMGQYCDTLGQK